MRKKLLLHSRLLLAAALFTFAALNAQTTILFQNFEASKTAIPAGWTQQQTAADPTNLGWQFGNSTTFNIAGTFEQNVPTHTYFGLVDDFDNNLTVATNYDTLYTPSFSCLGHSHVFVSFDLMNYVFNGYDTTTLVISTNGGKTWATVTGKALPANNFTWQDSLVYDISAYAANQANVMLGFAYFDGVPNSIGYPGAGIAIDNVDVFAPLDYDLSLTSQNLPYLMQVGNSYKFTGALENFGGVGITSLHMNYSVNGGAAQSYTINGITGFNGLTSYNFTDNLSFTPTAVGTYTVKLWADNLNGANADQNNKNDTLQANFMAISAVQPKMVLLEEFMNASCNPCMFATPNIDSVSANNLAKCNAIRYHVNFPGRDFMDSVTWLPFVQGRWTYYNPPKTGGVPQAQIDGSYIFPAYGSLSSSSIQEAANAGSAFGISITSATYTAATKTFALSANITAYGNFPAGITAQVALSVDTISYGLDQSQEDPQIYFDSPIGPYSLGLGIPDNLYPGLLHFPDVVEDMMPTANGTKLAAFSTNSTQSINVSWKVNHPWGIDPLGASLKLSDTTRYDSTQTARFTVFLQDKNGEPTLGVPAKYVYQSASAKLNYVLGVQEVSDGVYFEMYPNPAKGSTNLVYDIAKEENISIEVTNLLGEKVYSENLGRTVAGKHALELNGNGLPTGIYMVKFATDNSSTTKKLIIQ